MNMYVGIHMCFVSHSLVYIFFFGVSSLGLNMHT